MKKSILFILVLISVFIILIYRGQHIQLVHKESNEEYYQVFVYPNDFIELPETDYLLPESLRESVTYHVVTDSFIPLLSLYNRDGMIVSYSTYIQQESLPAVLFSVKEFQIDFFDKDYSSWTLIEANDTACLYSFAAESSTYYLILTDSKAIELSWTNMPYAQSYSDFNDEIYNSIIETYEALSQ